MSSFWHAACYCCDCYNWLCWFSLAVGDLLLYVLFLACCLLLLRLLRWVVLVSLGDVVFFCLCFALESFHWGLACGLLLLLFSWKMQKPNLATRLGKAFSDFILMMMMRNAWVWHHVGTRWRYRSH